MVKKRSFSEEPLIRGSDENAFLRWDLPSFDLPGGEPEELPDPEPDGAGEALASHIEAAAAAESPLPDAAVEPEAAEPEVVEPEPEAVPALTLEELEAIRQQAYDEGFASGQQDGHAEGLVRGEAEARQQLERQLQPRLDSLEQLMQHLLEPIADQDRAIEQGLLSLLGHLARQVIRRDLLMDSSQVTQVLNEALKLLPMGADNIHIHINPQDFEQIKALRERHEERWRLLEDSSLLPGGCRIETACSRIDATVETRLEQAIEQLLEQLRENATNPPDADVVEVLK